MVLQSMYPFSFISCIIPRSEAIYWRHKRADSEVFETVIPHVVFLYFFARLQWNPEKAKLLGQKSKYMYWLKYYGFSPANVLV